MADPLQKSEVDATKRQIGRSKEAPSDTGLEEESTAEKSSWMKIKREWPVPDSSSAHSSTTTASKAGYESMLQRWLAESMHEQPYHAISKVRQRADAGPPNEENVTIPPSKAATNGSHGRN